MAAIDGLSVEQRDLLTMSNESKMPAKLVTTNDIQSKTNAARTSRFPKGDLRCATDFKDGAGKDDVEITPRSVFDFSHSASIGKSGLETVSASAHRDPVKSISRLAELRRLKQQAVPQKPDASERTGLLQPQQVASDPLPDLQATHILSPRSVQRAGPSARSSSSPDSVSSLKVSQFHSHSCYQSGKPDGGSSGKKEPINPDRVVNYYMFMKFA
jgi:hypothetical protein